MLALVGLFGKHKQKVSTYSYGMKQRLGVAQALLGKPKILILDEPTNGLDVQSTLDFRNLMLKLKEKGDISILIASHQIGELELLCDRIGILKQGKVICEGTIDEVLNTSADRKHFIEMSTSDNSVANSLLQNFNLSSHFKENMIRVEQTTDENAREIIQLLIEHKIDINYFNKKNNLTLEELFTRKTKD